MDDLVAVRELAALLKVSPSTVTYYTQLGLFDVTAIDGKRKLYKKEHTVGVYKRIQQARKEGYPLSLIKSTIIVKSK
ncbi:MAG: MerR family transcriptional regulator [Candidatus Omnitrophica bacterium]|nr:MerR family transcriptional regulator [Candidatus Omnitrophota bacterium]MDD5488538.1 MerR family transcriptional regulator [Candidatus Omnitrophota bacterium]